MSLGRFTTWAVDRGIELVNLYHEQRGEVSRDELHVLLRNYGFAAADLDADDLERLAEELRSVFIPESSELRVERLNELLERFQPTPRLVAHDGQAPHFHYVTEGPPVDHIGSSFAMAWANAVVDQGAERFGWCAAPRVRQPLLRPFAQPLPAVLLAELCNPGARPCTPCTPVGDDE